jgi:hypothetical protein
LADFQSAFLFYNSSAYLLNFFLKGITGISLFVEEENYY